MDGGISGLIVTHDCRVGGTYRECRSHERVLPRAGDRHLVVPANSEQHFRKELGKLGYILAV